MFTALLIAALMQTATPAPPAPAPAATLSPAWKPAQPESSEYVRYARAESDGSTSAIFASRQVCDCQPVHAVELFQQMLASAPGVSIKHDTIPVCGETAQRVIISGLATPTNTSNNFEVLLFRKEPALFTLQYIYRYAAPMPDAEQALATLCPKP